MLVLTHLAATCFFNKYQFCGITVRPLSVDLLEFYYPHKDLKTASQVLFLCWSPILLEVYGILIYYFLRILIQGFIHAIKEVKFSLPKTSKCCH
jgi:hypothetical protein